MKETKKDLEELKDRKFNEESLEEVSGGADPYDPLGIKDIINKPNSKPYPGGMSGSKPKKK